MIGWPIHGGELSNFERLNFLPGFRARDLMRTNTEAFGGTILLRSIRRNSEYSHSSYCVLTLFAYSLKLWSYQNGWSRSTLLQYRKVHARGLTYLGKPIISMPCTGRDYELRLWGEMFLPGSSGGYDTDLYTQGPQKSVPVVKNRMFIRNSGTVWMSCFIIDLLMINLLPNLCITPVWWKSDCTIILRLRSKKEFYDLATSQGRNDWNFLSWQISARSRICWWGVSGIYHTQTQFLGKLRLLGSKYHIL